MKHEMENKYWKDDTLEMKSTLLLGFGHYALYKFTKQYVLKLTSNLKFCISTLGVDFKNIFISVSTD